LTNRTNKPAPLVLIVGGGITGLNAALTLDDFEIPSVIVEKSGELGGKVRGYAKTFPDFRSGRALVSELVKRVKSAEKIRVIRNCSVSGVEKEGDHYLIRLSDGKSLDVHALILAFGFEPFDATRQEEYGYGVYPNVIAAPELEALLDPLGPTKGRLLRPSDGKPVRKAAIIFCVGSRSKRTDSPYCSRICCSYSTKQAIEIKEADPEVQVVCFYMDIRTYDRGFEEMHQYAREIGVKYIRGRVSECSPLPDGDILVRAENTLLGKPVQGIFDLVSLSVGMMPSPDTASLAEMLGIELGTNGFFISADGGLSPHDTGREGIFLAGAVTGLKPIRDCILEGTSAGGRAAAYLGKRRG
jgi:heterodisulfide reductase subunit A